MAESSPIADSGESLVPCEKLEVKRRLEIEGRWENFELVRERLRRAKRDGGKSRDQANTESWREMIEAFPPLPSPEPKDESLTEKELLALKAKSGSTFRQDVQWVYDIFSDKTIRPDDAPSVGAWGLLQWARDSNRAKFYADLVPRYVAAYEEKEEKAAKSAKGEDGVLHSLIDALETEKLREQADQPAKCPACGAGLLLPVPQHGGDLDDDPRFTLRTAAGVA